MSKNTSETNRHDRCVEINHLFDAVDFRLGVREYEIFSAACKKQGLDASEIRAALTNFLSDVSTCPAFVLEHCEQLLKDAHQTK